ncbi:MAG: ATP-grasp domain-containing protein, partial [Nanoarchaeota archaeon]
MNSQLRKLCKSFDSNSKRIALLHHDIEPAELIFRKLLTENGFIVELFDIRKVKLKDLLNYDVIFNRVYSSVASRDYQTLSKTLKLINILEKKRILCINSYKASLADYNKYELYKMLIKNKVYTPKTLFINSKNKIKSISKKAVKELGFPIVVKRNCGGKSYEVTKVYTNDELINTLKKMFLLAETQGYGAGFIIQKFISSSREHDCRVAVLNNNYLYSYARTFIIRNSKDKWMASTSGGSTEINYAARESEIEIAIRANKAISSFFSESDIIMTNQGPCVIEVNPTAGYFVDSIDDIERMKMIVQSLKNYF